MRISLFLPYTCMVVYHNTIYTQLFTSMYTRQIIISISMKETGIGIQRLYTEAKHCVLRSKPKLWKCTKYMYVCAWYTNHNMFAALAWKRFEVFL